MSSGGPAERGTEGRGEGAGGHHSFVYGDLAQGLGASQGEGGHHALAGGGQAPGQPQLHGFHSPRQDGLDGGVRGQGGQAGRVG